jgi:hypothetical protein
MFVIVRSYVTDFVQFSIKMGCSPGFVMYLCDEQYNGCMQMQVAAAARHSTWSHSPTLGRSNEQS